MSIPGLTIIEDYITEKEEKDLLLFINSQKWLSVLSRRVQHYGYEYSYRPPYTLKNAPEIPKEFLDHVKELKIPFDQVIINEYLPGQGIGKHTDHKGLFGDVIASISLGSAIQMIFELNEIQTEIYIKPRTLLIMEDEARWKYTHQIPQRKFDVVNGETIQRGTRISLTFRTVQKND